MSRREIAFPVRIRTQQGLQPPGVTLRLAATRGQLSLELSSPVSIGPLQVTALTMSLPGLRFPLDLSGGVGRFRHRRGDLEHLVLETSSARLRDFFAPRVRYALGDTPCELSVLPAQQGLAFGLHNKDHALAFNALFAPDDDIVRWVITDARSVGLPIHSHGAALRAADSIVGRMGSRKGSVFTVDRAVASLVREVLLDAGARCPDFGRLRFTTWEETSEGIRLIGEREGAVPILPAAILRALEAAQITEDADNALAQGDLPNARDGYLKALERAPRHPDIAHRLAELDLVLEHRAETALAMLVEAIPAIDGGVVAAKLLAACGDQDGAMVAFQRAAAQEPIPRLAALLLASAAAAAPTPRQAGPLLDEAVARAPGLDVCRWQRAKERLKVGDAHGATADLECIEAAKRGSADRYDVCEKAGRLLLEARVSAEAARFFQKALRYLPSSPQASAGLARAFLDLGDGSRAVTLLSRAVRLASHTNPPAALVLELATSLAQITNDLPSAIAHARSIPNGSVESIDARALEGRWRAIMGDIAGASLAFAQAREEIESLPAVHSLSLHWLVEAAKFETEVRQDWRAAQRHLMVALQNDPHDAEAGAMFRRVGRIIAGMPANDAIPDGRATPPDAEIPPAPTPTQRPARPQIELEEPNPEVDESQITRLSERVQANPNDEEAVTTLCLLLHQAQRYLDLFALVSARLEESPPESMSNLLQDYRKKTLCALAEQARSAGRMEEASLYEQALEQD